MTIEIHKPELERRVREEIQSGHFRDVDDLLTKALDALHEQELKSECQSPQHLTGAELLAVLQASPHREIDLTPSRQPLPVRDVVI